MHGRGRLSQPFGIRARRLRPLWAPARKDESISGHSATPDAPRARQSLAEDAVSGGEDTADVQRRKGTVNRPREGRGLDSASPSATSPAPGNRFQLRSARLLTRGHSVGEWLPPRPSPALGPKVSRDTAWSSGPLGHLTLTQEPLPTNQHSDMVPRSQRTNWEINAYSASATSRLGQSTDSRHLPQCDFQTRPGPFRPPRAPPRESGMLREGGPEQKAVNPSGVALTLSRPLAHFIRVLELGHLREQGGAVQWPVVPPTGGLHQGREVGLRDV